jgi:hypothetical protein
MVTKVLSGNHTVSMACPAQQSEAQVNMPSLLDKPYWRANQTKSGPSPSEQLVDMENGYAVLEFTYRYLEAHARPPSDDEVHNVTATIARYQGPRVVPWAALELFLAELLTTERLGPG